MTLVRQSWMKFWRVNFLEKMRDWVIKNVKESNTWKKIRKEDRTLRKRTKSTSERREKTQTLRRGRRRSKPGANQAITPPRGGALAVWKQISKIVLSRSICNESKCRSSHHERNSPNNVRSSGKCSRSRSQSRERTAQDRNGYYIGERECGAEKDTIEMKHRDGKKADTAMLITPLMEQGMAERESPLIVRETWTNRVRLTTTGHIRIITAKAGGLTTHSLERKTYITLAATEQTSSIVQYLRSHVKNILVKGMHFHPCQLIPILRTHPGKMKKTN